METELFPQILQREDMLPLFTKGPSYCMTCTTLNFINVVISGYRMLGTHLFHLEYKYELSSSVHPVHLHRE